jgi:Rieske Fe-S protein
MEPIDFLGFLGRNPGARNVYIVTADSGMGMTHGTIAGLIISELVQGRDHPWAALYDPGRKTLGAVADYARENLNAAASFVAYATRGEIDSVDALAPGEGAVIRSGARKIAAYRDVDGELHVHSAVCTHVGCLVHWNAFERCWDCGCHGSQFDIDGNPMTGPASKPLATVELEAETRATTRRAPSAPARSDRSETAPHSLAPDRDR